VSRLLKRAQDEGIVRITVGVPHGVFPELEEELQALYGLKRAIVVDTVEDDEQILRDIGAAAAYYLETTLKNGEIVGISSWSATLLSMVDALHGLPASVHAQVVQILGGLGNPAAEAHANSLTHRLARLLHGDSIFLPVPGVAGSAESRTVLLADPFVRSTLDLFDHVTLALVGIGALEPSRLLASSGNIFAPEETALLRARGAVGDICLHFFDRAGTPVITPLDARVISMSLQQLKRVRRSVGIAGGSRKLAAIRGALAGRWINVLITDRFTAERLAREEAGSRDVNSATVGALSS
jgi:DNA-binding transcriptional regulator LsrR (DeoR family)